jgi:hypothetical protein
METGISCCEVLYFKAVLGAWSHSQLRDRRLTSLKCLLVLISSELTDLHEMNCGNKEGAIMRKLCKAIIFYPRGIMEDTKFWEE